MWLFFRNDDFGWNPPAFARLVTLFAKYDQKLNAAAIPMLMTDDLVKASIPYSYQAAPFLQVVSNGFRHQNFQDEETKSEYGSSRSLETVKRELEDGRLLLAERFENYFPCFVPPWNHCSDIFLPLLPETGYKMLSRCERNSSGRASLPEFDTFLDLQANPRLKSKDIFAALAKRNEERADYSGLTLHHDTMTENDFQVVEELLKDLSKRSIPTCFFSDLIPGSERRDTSGLSHL